LPLNLCGAHAPLFARNIVLLKDTAGHTGIGEAPLVIELMPWRCSI
jgi:hypothetical protein